MIERDGRRRKNGEYMFKFRSAVRRHYTTGSSFTNIAC